MDLKESVRKNIRKLGVQDAAEFYHVSVGTVSNWLNGKTSPSIEAVELTLAESAPVAVKPLPEPYVLEKLTDWAGRKVAILLPSYKSFNPDTHWTLMANYAKYGPEKIAILPPIKGTVIHEARNRLIAKAMETDAQSFIMVDDDMILPVGNQSYFNNTYRANLSPFQGNAVALSRLMSHKSELGIVGALYFGRHPKGRAQCELGFTSTQESGNLRISKYSNPIPMRWVGTGLIRIERWVIEKLDAAIKEGKFEDCKPKREDLWNGYFTPLAVGVGEDVSFGTRCHSLGIPSYLDPQLVCLHAGESWFGPHNTNG
jgi:transcriptional regulator with XRE-family HTH domain